MKATLLRHARRVASMALCQAVLCQAVLCLVLLCLAVPGVLMAQTTAALSFDGVDDQATTTADLDLSGSFTIEFWARRTVIDVDHHIVSQGTTGDNVGLSLGFGAGNKFRFQFGGGNDLLTSAAYEGAQATAWHHYAVTYDAGTLARVIYRDGDEAASDVASAAYAGSGPLVMGSKAWNADYLRGQLDEVRIWDHVRTESQIEATMDTPLDGDENGLVAYWLLDAATGSAATDLAGGLTAAFSGGTAWSQPGALFAMNATDALFEDRVELTWPATTEPGSSYQIKRDGDLLAVMARTDTFYADDTGDPGTVYEYCLTLVNINGVETVTVCDDGSRVLKAPTGVDATDGVLSDQVLVSWTDRSLAEDGYRVFRDQDVLSFDGVDDYVEVPEDPAFDFDGTASFTVEVWFNFTGDGGTGNANAHLVAKRPSGDNNDYPFALTNNRNQGKPGQMLFTMKSDGTSFSAETGRQDFNDGAWHHMVAVYDADVRKNLLYIDGALEAEISNVGIGALENDRPLELGTRAQMNNRWFEGQLADVRIWNTARTHAQARTRVPLVGDEAGLAAAFPLDEGTGTTTTDLVAGLTGDLVGGPAWDTATTLPLAVLDANTIVFSDQTGDAGEVFDYCVEAIDANGFASTQDCDDGFRGFVLPPSFVTASDGQYNDFVRLDWGDPLPDEDGFNVYRGRSVLAFDGVDDNVLVPNTAGWLPLDADARTLELWFKTDGAVSDIQTLAHYGDGGGTGDNYLLRIKSNGTLSVGLLNQTLDGSTAVDDGLWHHVAVTFDGVNAHVLYLDGVQDGTHTLGLSTPDSDFSIGATLGGGSEFAGQLYDVRVWDIARSMGDIAADMDATLDGTEAGLAALFLMNEGAGTTTTDAVGAIEGTLDGATWAYGPQALLAALGPDVTTYEDATAASGVVLDYCVATLSGGTESVQVCDEGMRGGLAAPADVAATFDVFDNRVEITWTDVANTEDGFEVMRDGTLIATTLVDDERYVDYAALQGQSYEYCVRAFSKADPDNPSYSDEVCADGRRAYVLAPEGVAATDGSFEGRVSVAWTSPSTTTMLYKVYRVNGSDTTFVDTLPINVPLFDDTGIPSDVVYDYCVAGVTVAEAASAAQAVVGPALSANRGGLRLSGVWQSEVEAGRATPMAARKMSAVQAALAQAGLAAAVEHESAKTCDAGHRSLGAPANVAATFDETEDHVQITWSDNSAIETAFDLYRLAPEENGGLSFDGDNDRVSVAEDAAFDFDGTGSFTVEVWFNFTGDGGTGTSNAHLVAKRASGGTGNYPFALFNNRSSGMPGELQFRMNSGSDVFVQTERDDFNDGAWHHAAAVYDAVAETARLYIDGSLEGETSTTGLGDTSNDKDLYFGRRGGLSAQYFGGELDEVRIWSRVRTQDELIANAHRRLDGTESGLAAYWPLDEGTGSAIDLVGGLTGTLTGTAWTTTDGGTVYGDLIQSLSSNRGSVGDYGGMPGVTYAYTLVARDAAGTSRGDSDTGRRSLLAPSVVKATDGVSESDVTITWADNSAAEDGYEITREGVLIHTTGPNVTEYVDAVDAAEVGIVATYGVAAIDGFGASEIIEDTGFAELQGPGNLSASTSYASEVVLVWTDVSTLNDGYTVYRDGTEIANTLGAGATAYTDTGATGDHDYCVESTTTGGSVSVQSCAEGGLQAAGSAQPDVETIINAELIQPLDGAAGDAFGQSIALDGSRALVGAYKDKSLGRAASFRGATNSRIDNFRKGDFMDVDDLTVEFWINVENANGANDPTIIDMVKWTDEPGLTGGVSNPGSQEDVLSIWSSRSGGVDDILLCFAGGNCTGRGSAGNEVDVIDGEWHHVAIRWNGANGNVNFYKDGSFVDSRSSGKTNSLGITIEPLDPDEFPLCFRVSSTGDPYDWCDQSGRLMAFGQRHANFNSTPSSYSSGRSLEGLLDEVRFWNEARELSDIKDDRFKVLTGEEENLIGYWRFERKEALEGGNGDDDVEDLSPLGLHADTDNIDLVEVDIESGAALVFEKGSTGEWTQTARLIGDGRRSDTHLGNAVDLAGNYAIVGVEDDDEADTDAGAAYLFFNDNGTWVQTEKWMPASASDAHVGSAVALTPGATFAFVGADGTDPGAVYVYERTGTTWALAQTLAPTDAAITAGYGRSIAVDGDFALVGSSNADRRAEVLAFDGAAWGYLQSLSGDESNNENLGFDVALSGDRAVIGAPFADEVGANAGVAYVYAYDAVANQWAVTDTLHAGDGQASDKFGRSVAVQGDYIVVGADDEDEASTNAGAAYLFRWDGTQWVEIKKFIPGQDDITGTVEDGYGYAVALHNGDLLTGAPKAFGDQGVVYPARLPVPPSGVFASNGTYDNRIQVTWNNTAVNHDGFNIYRSRADGTLEQVSSVGATVTSYGDFDVPPGGTFKYCVTAFNDALLAEEANTDPAARLGETAPTKCSVGWRPPDGYISGRLASSGGGGTPDAAVCLLPSPNRALLFDGIGGTVVTDGEPDLTGSFTIEFWAQRSVNGVNHRLVSQGEDTNNKGLAIGFGSGNAFRLEFGGNDLVASNNYTSNNWHHWAVTYDVSDNNRRAIFRDGVEVISDEGMGAYAGSGPIVLGANAWGGEHFSGQLDEVRIWNHARTEAQIAAAQDAPLAGDETGLLAYWSLDEGTGLFTIDLTDTNLHGEHAGGVHWTESDALDVCDITDLDGNYTLGNLRYGESTTFTVKPSGTEAIGDRVFTPGTKSVTLSPESPVQNGVDFTDASAYTVSGLVQFEGTLCPVPDVDIFLTVPGEEALVKASTKDDGSFSISVDPSVDDTDTRIIEPRLTAGAEDQHTFSPAQTTLVVSENTADVDFESQKTRVLTGYFGGSCGVDIGSADIRIFTQDGCFETTLEDVQGSFSISLPPQPYLVQVTGVETDNDALRADIISFFDNLGVVEVDLTAEADTLDLVYHAPISLSIVGLEGLVPDMCEGDVIRQLDPNDEDVTLRSLPVVPIIGAGADVALTIAVNEDYGGGFLCPLESGSLTLYDGIADLDPQTFEVEDGEVAYSTFGASPNTFVGAQVDGVDRSLQKSITAIVDVPGRGVFTETEWAIVEGVRNRTATFVSATTDPIPMMVLHDPPGSNSYAYVEEGTTVCESISSVKITDGGAGPEVDLALGFKSGAGIGVVVENGAGLTIRGSTIVGREDTKLSTGACFNPEMVLPSLIGTITTFGALGAFLPFILTDECPGDPVDRNLEICMTTTERWSTPADQTWVGEDVYAGVALNLIFAEADNLNADQCTVKLSEALAMDLDPDDAFETSYVYGGSHIEYSLIPALEDLKALDEDASLTGDPDGDGSDETISLDDAILNWKYHLALGDTLTTLGVAGDCAIESDGQIVTVPCTDDLLQLGGLNVGETLPFPVENRSFSSGADYEYSVTLDTLRTTFAKSTRFHFTTEGGLGPIVTGAGYDQVALAAFQVNQEFVTDSTNTQSNATTIGYVLSDGDTGDFFSVDVGTDPIFKTPVFEVVSGRSSNPHEGNTQERDGVTVSINPPAVFDVPPDESANFTLSITNTSPSQERRTYTLAAPGETNPGNAGLLVTGDLLGGERLETFLINPGETHSLNLSVLRGPVDYSYDSLAVIVYPPTERDIWLSDTRQPFALADTAWFSVHYQPPCAESSLLRPLDPWTFNSSSDSLDVIVHEFALNGNAFLVEEIGVEYRREGETEIDWLPIYTLTYAAPDDLSGADLAAFPDGCYQHEGACVIDPEATSFSTKWAPPMTLPGSDNDGGYELQSYTSCGAGNEVFSTPVPGTADTKLPLVLGTPAPADALLDLGDDVSALFDEEIECLSLITSSQTTGDDYNIELRDADDALVPIDVVCDGKTVVMAPQDTGGWSTYEGQTLTAKLLGTVEGTVDGVTDLLGNRMEDDVEWSFTVRQNTFAFLPVNAAVQVGAGSTATITTTLHNGSGIPQAYTLEDVPTWLTPSITESAAYALPSGGQQPITFTVADTLALGMYADTLRASSAMGDVFFYPTVEVVTPSCVAPAWAPSVRPFAMTVIGRLQLEGVDSIDPNDRVAAFVGDEVRGVANVSDTDSYLTLTIYSDLSDGEVVTFKAWDADACHLYEHAEATFVFDDGATLGTVDVPIVLNATDVPQIQAIALAAGWSALSINRQPSSTSLSDVLVDLAPISGDLIKSQTAFSIFDLNVGGWVGSLNRLEPGEAYQVFLTEPRTLFVEGSPVEAEEMAIAVGEGWNWLGYLPQSALPVDDALATYPAADNDLIKTHSGGYAQYMALGDGGAWIGSLTEMTPGHGYLFFSHEGGTLHYPDAALAPPTTAEHGLLATRLGAEPDASPAAPRGDDAQTARAKPAADLEEEVGTGKRLPSPRAADAPAEDEAVTAWEGWALEQGAFPHTMTLTGTLELGGRSAMASTTVGAFVDGEVRGFARLQYVPALDAHRFFLTVYGVTRDGEQITFRLHDAETGEERALSEQAVFEADAMRGTPLEPIVLGTEADAVAESLQDEGIPTTYALDQNYPNPFNPVTTIRYALPEASNVSLVVFDMLGRSVMTLVRQDQNAGRYEVAFDASALSSGVYFYLLKADGFQQTRKMVLLK